MFVQLPINRIDNNRIFYKNTKKVQRITKIEDKSHKTDKGNKIDIRI